MASLTIDFRAIRPHHGSQHSGFEELVCQFAALETPLGIPFHRKGRGADGGLECYRVERDGSETGWQAKYFFKFGNAEAAQLTKSFDNALATHAALTTFIACIPFDLTDGRVTGQISERERWNKWVHARQAAIAPRIIEIQLWAAFQLTERLTRNDPLYVGRRTYWFDLPHFGHNWFIDRFNISRVSLGRRYSPELNIELPIRKALIAFARDPEFANRVASWADDLELALHAVLPHLRTALGEAYAQSILTLREELSVVCAALRNVPSLPSELLPIAQWQTLLDSALRTFDICREALWSQRRQEGNRDRDSPLRSAIRYGEQLRDALENTRAFIGTNEVTLANANRLLVSGEAGVGKSHLLADVAQHHTEQGFPAVLMLGSAFTDAEPWRQVAEQLGLTSLSPDAILGALDSAGEAAGARALIMIDAINERNGIAIWSERLAGFFAAADRFRNVGILVSCRTTFIPYIVRDIEEEELPRLRHPGFAGRASEAARRYLDQRGIVRMAVPHFAPEFENPLFLRTCCDMLDRSGQQTFPRGLAGVSATFNFYFEAVVTTINNKMGLTPRRRRVEAVLEALTTAMVSTGSGYLDLNVSMDIIESLHPSGGRVDQDLFVHLESEGVITVEPVSDGNSLVEVVRFTFERMSDHRIAQGLLDAHVVDEDVSQAFQLDGPLYSYVAGRGSHRFAGIAEALAVQIPERYGVELMDLVDNRLARWQLVQALQFSLRWRRHDVFTERTLELVEECSDIMGVRAVLETLLDIATEPDNRFNADHLDRLLMPLALHDRDIEWTTNVMTIFSDSEENGAVKTLIEWVLTNGLDLIEPPRARLAAITLAWLTSLSHRWVRDMATKALATLLVNRRELAAALIDHFAEVDDPYILDRVLAAAYGSATRTPNTNGLAALASSAYRAVFEGPIRPVHALIRDHARGIIELAQHRGVLPATVSIEAVSPPYQRGMPLELIGEETLASYVQDYGRGQFSDEICSSAIKDGDFARYKIDSLAADFLMLPPEEYGRSMAEIYDAWRNGFIVAHPDRLEALDHLVAVSEQYHSMPSGYEWGRGLRINEQLQEEKRAYEKIRVLAVTTLESLLTENEVQEFRVRAAGYLRGRMWDENANTWHVSYRGDIPRRWVAWRAHELGWTADRFGDFDRQTPNGDRMEHRVERIGKKYQWIAYHELVGRLSDIALLKAPSRDEPMLYEGPWQVGTREMDPTVLVTHSKQQESNRQQATWWAPHTTNWRIDSPESRIAWMEDEARDIPDPVQQIDVTDPNGRRWLVLNTFVSKDQRVMVNGSREYQRMSWHKLKSMIVPRSELQRLKAVIATEDERDPSPSLDLFKRGYLGEYPWHPAFSNVDGTWEVGRSNPVEVQATVADWYMERSGHDYSIEESITLTVPAPALIHGLDLQLAEGRSLSYATADGTILFKDPSIDEPGDSAAVVDYSALRSYLDSQELEVVWIFSGEKSVHGGHRGWGGMLSYWGMYLFNGNVIKGSLTFSRQDASADQLEELMSNP